MNDILTALKSEKRTLDSRAHIIDVCLNRTKYGLTYEALSQKTYTDSDLKEVNDRLEEVKAAITAIELHRKSKNI